MKLLITGGCGCLGRAVVKACAAKEYDAVVLDRTESALESGGIQAEITDIDAVFAAAEGCDAIIHTAAFHGAERGKVSSADFISVNVIGADNVFQAALHHGIKRVVIASSMEVLLGKNWAASGMTVLDGQSPPRPDWIYPVTKLQIETLGGFYSKAHGLEVPQLRYVAFSDVPIRDLGYALLAHYVTSHDAASAAIAAVEKKGLSDEVLMIGPDTPLTQRDINEAIKGNVWEVLEYHWPGCRDVLEGFYGPPEASEFWPVTRTETTSLILGWKPRCTFDLLLQEMGWKANESKMDRNRVSV